MRNKKARLITTLSVAIAIAHLSGCGKTLSYDEYMVAAKTQIEQGDASSAILSLKNAVRLKPKDVNVYCILTKVICLVLKKSLKKQ